MPGGARWREGEERVGENGGREMGVGGGDREEMGLGEGDEKDESARELESEIVEFLQPQEVFAAYCVGGRGGARISDVGGRETGDRGEEAGGGGGGGSDQGESEDGKRMNVGGFVRLLQACGIVPAQLHEVCVCVLSRMRCVCLCSAA